MEHPTKPMLIEALEHLAADPEEQEQYLRSFGTWPLLDELAQQLDDIREASEVWMWPELRERVQLLDQELHSMSGQKHAELWKPEALRGVEWGEVRQLAVDALDALRRHS